MVIRTLNLERNRSQTGSINDQKKTSCQFQKNGITRRGITVIKIPEANATGSGGNTSLPSAKVKLTSSLTLERKWMKRKRIPNEK